MKPFSKSFRLATIGLVLGGIHSVAVARNLVANGDFSNGTNGWTFTQMSGHGNGNGNINFYKHGYAALSFANCTVTLSQCIPTVVSNYYAVTFYFDSSLQDGENRPFNPDFNFGSATMMPNYTNYVFEPSSISPPGLYDSSPQRYDFIIQATSTNTVVSFTGNVSQAAQVDVGNVSVISLPLPPLNLSASGNQMTFSFAGTASTLYALQCATNLTPPVNWQPVTTNTSDAGGNWSVTLTNTVSSPCGYFRAALPLTQ